MKDDQKTHPDATPVSSEDKKENGSESHTEAERKPKAPASDEVVVEIKSLKKAFGSKVVLKDINLKLKKGENLVVLGKSGTGKSVLIKCIVGLIPPDDGEILVEGKKIDELEQPEWDELRSHIGFLFQGSALYDSMSVRENLAFALRRSKKSDSDIETLVKEALQNVGLAESIDKKPSELSGGMQKRISLARTLILKPDILLYDEPTTGLDTITAREISHLILDVQEKFGTSSIIITHDMKCAELTGNRVVILNEGACLAEGSYDELRNSKEKAIRSFFE
jgi:phospholipid/cholesterol/gamma-HCH transport system ATP-binding protein